MLQDVVVCLHEHDEMIVDSKLLSSQQQKSHFTGNT